MSLDLGSYRGRPGENGYLDDAGSVMSRHTVMIEDLERWVLSGAQWRIINISQAHAVVELCACTGEAMVRVESDVPIVIEYLRAAPITRQEV